MICSLLVTLVNLPQFSWLNSRTFLSLTSLPNPITAQPALGLGAHRDVCMCERVWGQSGKVSIS